MIQKLKEYSKYLLVFTMAVLIYAIITDFDKTTMHLNTVIAWFMYILNKFIIGFTIAYIMNFFVMFLRKRFKLAKGLAIAASYIVLLSCFAFLILYIIPVISEGGTAVAQNFSGFYSSMREIVNSAYLKLSDEIIVYIDEFTNNIGPTLYKMITGFFNVSSIESVLKSSTRIASNIFFGVIISIYALVEKERLMRNARLIIAAAFTPKKATRLFDLLRAVNLQFSKFLVGKFLDSLIIGLLSYIAYTIFKIPLTPFLAIIAGVTNMIPYFGPFIGGVIAVPIVLCFDPTAALYTLIIIIILQTIDGMLLGPKILGDAVGISPFLTIVAITIGGDLAGFIGMLIGVPIMAVIKTMFYHEFLQRKKDKLTVFDEQSGGDKNQLSITDDLNSLEQSNAEAAKRPEKPKKIAKNRTKKK